MANKYARAAGGNWSADATWSLSSGGPADTTAPTAADDVFLDSASGNVTINATAACRSLDCDTYTGTLAHTSAIAFNIGDATAGAGNRALRFVAGMTYSCNATTTSPISFISTSATQQTVDYAGKLVGSQTFDGIGGSWILSSSMLQAATGTNVLTFNNGALDINGQTVTMNRVNSVSGTTRVFTLGASTITVDLGSANAWNLTSSNMTFSGASSTITLTGTTAAFAGAGLTYGTVNLTGAGTASVTGSGSVFATFNRTSTAVKGDAFSITSNFTVTGTLTLAGNSSINRLLVQSSVLGTSRTITKTGATVTASNVDFEDITFTTGTTDLSAITGGSGDCGGNSGITFTTAATKYWVANTGNWDDPTNHWATSTGGAPGATNLPLPQDDVVFDANSFSSGSRTVTGNMPRIGKSVTWTGVTNSPAWTLSSSTTLHGSMTLVSAMTFSSGGQTLTFRGRGSSTLTSASQDFGATQVLMFGGTLTLSDAFSCSGHTTTITNGTVNFGAFTHTIFALSSAGSVARTLNLDSSTLLLGNGGGAATILNFSTPTNLTFNAGTSTIKISSTDANTKTFSGGDRTFNNIVFTGTGTGIRRITGTSTYAAITNDNTGTAFAITFSAGTTTTVGSLALVGNAANLITLNSSTPASAFTLTDSTGTNTAYYCSIQDSTATGGATWNAYNSTNVSGNTGWNFLSLGPSRGTLALLGCGA